MTIDQAAFKFNIEKPADAPKEKKAAPVLDSRVKQDDYPIIGDAGFTTPFLVARHEDKAMLRWMREHWHYFNIHRFKGVLKEPHFALLNDVNINRLRKRGDWTPYASRIRLTPSLFQPKDERYANHVLIHEMAHQYVSEQLGGETVEQGHGPKWKGVMVDVGLTPNRYDFTNNRAFMNKLQIEEKEKDDKMRSDLLFERNPLPFKVYGYAHRRKIKPCMYVGKDIKTSERIVILETNTQSTSYMIPALYIFPERGLAEKIEHNVEWMAKVKRVRELLKEVIV